MVSVAFEILLMIPFNWCKYQEACFHYRNISTSCLDFLQFLGEGAASLD